MSSIKLAGLVTLLASSITSAYALPCDSFRLNVKNSLQDDLWITEVKLTGAEIQKPMLEKLASKAEMSLVVNHTSDQAMDGVISLHTLSAPTKTVRIRYSLKNDGAVCKLIDYSPQGDYAVEQSSINKDEVNYTIHG